MIFDNTHADAQALRRYQPNWSYSMQLIHYGRKPLTKVISVKQQHDGFLKPRGLWVSVGDSWAAWAHDNRYAIGNVSTRVMFKDDARILLITSADALDHFTDRYGTSFKQATGINMALDRISIDWPKVADDYQGIIISPYLYERRLNTFWYSGWDCACGCIWDAEAVKKLEPASQRMFCPKEETS